jgi:SAM-dependent methyltransferase
MATQAVNEERLHEFVGKVVTDLGATISAGLVVIGERLGLYRALAEFGPLTPEELAEKTDTAERYVREWLLNQAASGYAEYDPSSGRYSLTPEQAFALADESSPAYMPGAFQLSMAALHDRPAIEKCFRTGEGFAWGDHEHGLFEGTERFFGPGYRGNLLSSWIPSLDGVHERLEQGAHVADIGCGHGTSTVIMAEAYPRSTFVGYDNHDRSIETARRRAAEAGVSDRVTFEVAAAQDFPAPAGGFDFVALFDCLHDMGDPVGAASHIRQSLSEDGVCMIVEPLAGDRVEDNLNPIGRLYSAASTFLCVPHSISENGPALGAQAGQARLEDVLRKGGFTQVRRAAEAPANMVLEAK